MIELKHLKTLRALRKTGNLTRAADMLHLTQSAVSQQIRLLESNYGLLFERKSVPVAFTIIGQRLLELADTVIPAIEDAERNLIRLKDGTAGTLRIAVECHTCFDWLMPAMDIFRSRWPEVELDIISGFHADPVALLHQHRADLAIVGVPEPETGIAFSPLFHFEILALLARHHPLNNEPFLRPEHFATETLITYPVPDDMLDIMRQVLLPAGISPERRTSELTVAILQLVASGRGIAALPLWAVKSYLDKQYVVSRPITEKGLTGKLYAATRSDMSDKSYIRDFIRLIRERSLCELPGIRLLN
ncbi:LysR family transcriptional regulator [Oxalobacter sp. OxGP1]|uniref:LysR family transcriptional regulator n=1 Tax=Oxalobacter paeniformigenes TaxID=2946594 RepID=UPI0022AF0985|nr:LysR family transcriptional regulator [Oxalobacter paeniformigenes]MCZ4052839.1 LysR family transcriptional regulator [Oxalobacter paeniformigenes]